MKQRKENSRKTSDGIRKLENPFAGNDLPFPSNPHSPIPASGRIRSSYMNETNGGGSLEDVPGFNGFRARHHSLLPVPPAPAPRSEPNTGERLEVTIGDDDRVPVDDSSKLPWRCIALLTIQYESGRTAFGTAWFIGPTALATAGHNIRHPREGEARSIVVSPGYDGHSAIFNSYPAVQAFCEPEWTADPTDPTLDYGVVSLADPTIGQRLGWFGFADYEDERLERLVVNLSGYPGDRGVRRQHFNAGRILPKGDFLHYEFDTSEGMSGSPIFALFKESGARVGVGIHTGSVDRLNRARRITQRVYDALARFV
jgi:V8-like Glu-specific endopeptidase